MRFGILFNQDLDTRFQHSGIPAQWPVEAVFLKGDTPCPAGYREFTSDDLEAHKLVLYAEYVRMQQEYNDEISGTKLRVADLVAPQFANYHPAQIDFRRHLLPGIVLMKNVIMAPNGRPEVAQYFYGGKIICEIKFVFTTNAMNFMTKREEKLGYYTLGGSVPEYYVISSQDYDLNNPYYMAEAVNERFQARTLIFNQIKAVCNGVLYTIFTSQGKTYPEILDIASLFWKEFNDEVNDWLNTGSSALKNALLTDTVFTFFDNELAAGVTIRQYIINKISY